MPTVFAALMCHAPIVIPAVGGPWSASCVGTTRAMREIAQRAVRSRPDRLVVVSPHSPRPSTGAGAWRGLHRGDLAAFGAPQARFALPDATMVSDTLPEISEDRLDHGASVPLWFLWEAGWRGPTAIVSAPVDRAQGAGSFDAHSLDSAPPDGSVDAGSLNAGSLDAGSLGASLARLPGRTAVIGSGDLSHRLHPGAPGGYHPRAQTFDAAFLDALHADDWETAVAVGPPDCAAPGLVDAARVAMAAAGSPRNAEVLRYAAPLGVGHAEAILHDADPPLYAMARLTARSALLGRPLPRFPGGPGACGVFVSMYLGRALRGCGGTIRPRGDRLHDEVVRSTIAAMRDARVRTPSLHELPDIEFEVSLLGPLSSTGPEGLDPTRFGLVVSSGERKALVLPGLKKIRTPEDQVRAGQQRAGIPPHEPTTLHRFTLNVETSP